jgi:thioesterase domain-containing protein
MNQNYSELIPLRASGRALPLFCIHDENFEHVAAAMPENQPVYGLRPINLDDSKVDLSVQQLALEYLRLICGIQASGPYQLAGYSVGALLAYEIATLLADRGEKVSLLVLIDRNAWPSSRQNTSLAERKRIRRIYLADRFRKYGRNLSQGRIDRIWLDVSQYAERIRPIAWRIAARVCRKLGCSMPSFMHSKFAIFAAMSRSYTPKEFNGRVVLFRPEKRPPEEDVDPFFGWQEVAKEGVDLQFLPGEHTTMMENPNARFLAEKLVSYLEFSSSEVQSH